MSTSEDSNILTHEILKMLYPPTEAAPIVVYGKLGKGKSSFSILTLVTVLMAYFHWSRAFAWDKVKELIVFHPRQFFDKVKRIRQSGIRSPGIVWDDAGVWLNAMRYNDPFIKAVGEYLNVMRSSIAALFLTTPDDQYIYKKIRMMPDSFKVQIDYPRQWDGRYGIWGRQARYYTQKPHVYHGHRTVRLKRRDPGDGQIKPVADNFNCKMPDPFYAWYKPLRDSYEEMALDRMVKEWERLEESDQIKMLEEYPGLQIPDYNLGNAPIIESWGYDPLENMTVDQLTFNEKLAMRVHYPDQWAQVQKNTRQKLKIQLEASN